MRAVLLAALALAGCFDPRATPACAIACGAGAECGDGMTCDMGVWRCVRPGDSCGAALDALGVDAPSVRPDATTCGPETLCGLAGPASFTEGMESFEVTGCSVSPAPDGSITISARCNGLGWCAATTPYLPLGPGRISIGISGLPDAQQAYVSLDSGGSYLNFFADRDDLIANEFRVGAGPTDLMTSGFNSTRHRRLGFERADGVMRSRQRRGSAALIC